MRLVISIARKYQNNGLDLDELITEGSIGLAKAIERYDSQRGTRLSTFATFWIKKHVIRAVENTGREIRIPHTVSEAVWKVVKTRKNLQAKINRGVETEDISGACDMSNVTVEKLLEIHNARPEEVQDYLVHTGSQPEDMHLQHAMHRILFRSLSGLTSTEENVVRMIFGIGYIAPFTKKEISFIYNVSEKIVNKIGKRAICKLQTAMF